MIFADIMPDTITGIGLLITQIFNTLGIAYAVLRKERRTDRAEDVKSDKTLADVSRKMLSEALERHAKEYSQFIKEREEWRKEASELRDNDSACREENASFREKLAKQSERIDWLERTLADRDGSKVHRIPDEIKE